MASVDNIASSISAEIARQNTCTSWVKAVMEEGGKDEWIAWFQFCMQFWWIPSTQ